jgi:hypothetical protein
VQVFTDTPNGPWGKIMPKVNEKWVLCKRKPTYDSHYLFEGLAFRDFTVPGNYVRVLHTFARALLNRPPCSGSGS